VLCGIIRVTPDGQYTILADRFEGKKFNSPNDVVLGPDGALYFTDPTAGPDRRGEAGTSLSRSFPPRCQGKVTLLTKELSQPNGLAFSPDGKKFYVDDSQQSNIRVYDFQPNGTLANGRIFGEEPGGKEDGVPDGIKVDRTGNLYITGPGGIGFETRKASTWARFSCPNSPLISLGAAKIYVRCLSPQLLRFISWKAMQTIHAV
jgi:gluconolactonase